MQHLRRGLQSRRLVGGRDGVGKDSSDIFSARFSETQRGSWEGVGWGAGSSSISSSALDDEAGWRVRDPSWVEDVESSSSVNGSASYFEWEWRGRIYAEGELAGNIICCSAGTFDAEWGGRDGVGNESGDYSIISSARCLATQMGGRDGGGGGTGGISISSSARCSENGWRRGDPSGAGDVMGRSTVQGSTCFLEAEGEGREGVEGEPVECIFLAVVCNHDAWWGGRDGIGKDSSYNCIFCSTRHSVIYTGGRRIWFWDKLDGSFNGGPNC